MNHIKTLTLSTITLLAMGHTTLAQQIAAGGWHSLVICNDSTVRAFGENATGQLGDGTNTDSSTPLSVAGLSGVVAVSAGGDQLEAHSMALKSDGTVWCWGSNLYGGLGNGSTNQSGAPVQAIGLSNVVAISAGGWHSAALKADGTVWAWGWNTDGQLGDGTTTDHTIPAQVPGLNNIVAIEAGTYHTLALKNDGTVWAWGDNVSGQVGNNTNTDQLTPVQVMGLTNVAAIAAGRFYSLAVKTDGTVWTWGENLYGQLGDGTTTDRLTPVQVPNLTGVIKATCGAFESHVIKTDGTAWAWGRNTYGNLGDGTVANSSVPVQMVGVSGVEGIACGTNFTLVYLNDGSFYGCGRNASGQLGDGTFTQHNTLTQSPLMCPILQVTVNSADLEAQQHQISVYPNPITDGTLNIRFTENQSHRANAILALHDLAGKQVFQINFDLSNSTELPVNLIDMERGSYILTIKAGDLNFTQRIIKL